MKKKISLEYCFILLRELAFNSQVIQMEYTWSDAPN